MVEGFLGGKWCWRYRACERCHGSTAEDGFEPSQLCESGNTLPQYSLPPECDCQSAACQYGGNRAIHSNSGTQVLGRQQIHGEESLTSYKQRPKHMCVRHTARKFAGRYASDIKAATFIELESFWVTCATFRITLLSSAVSLADTTILPMSLPLPVVKSSTINPRIFSSFTLLISKSTSIDADTEHRTSLDRLLIFKRRESKLFS